MYLFISSTDTAKTDEYPIVKQDKNKMSSLTNQRRICTNMYTRYSQNHDTLHFRGNFLP